jgi:hypothetical protein
MRSNELRIGNWVWNDVQKMPYQVDGNLIGLYHGREKAGVEVGLSPVLLTEEWLIKFGLYNNLKLNYNKRQGVEYRFSKKKLGTYIIKRYYNNSLYNMQFVYDDKHNNIPNEQIWVNIKHVHQLQNLYFALTGKELTIKE